MRECMRRCGVAMALLLLGGCCLPGPAPRSAAEALDRIDANLAKVTGPIYAKALASVRFRDQQGQTRRFIGQPAVLLFQAPQCMLFEVRGTLGGVFATIGSSDERYWLWIDTPEQQKLWWGSWSALAQGKARSVAMAPDKLLDALMLRTLAHVPRSAAQLTSGLSGATLRFPLAISSRAGVTRELRLDACPPYMPLEITDRDRAGVVLMQAQLAGYAPLQRPDGPSLARRYVIRWPTDDAELRLDINNLRYRTQDTPFCDFPSGWQADSEILDAPESLSSAAPRTFP